MKGQEVPLGEAISALGLPDPGAALELLQALLEQQALWGFRAP